MSKLKKKGSNSYETTAHMEGQAEGQRDRQYFKGFFRLFAEDPASTTPADCHLKVKDKEYDTGLSKNYCITNSMQKTSSLDKSLPKIQQILGSHELNGHI